MKNVYITLFVRFVCFTRAREGREKSEEAEVRIVVGKEHQGPTERAKVRDVDCHSGSLSLYSFFFSNGLRRRKQCLTKPKQKKSLSCLLPTC